MPSWEPPKTDYNAASNPGPSDLNRIEGNIYTIELNDRTPSEAVANPTATGPLGTLLSAIATMLKAVSGEAHWYTKPLKTLADKLDKSGGDMTGPPKVAGATTLVSKRAGRKSWLLTHPDDNTVTLQPSTLVDGEVVDVTKGLAFLDTGLVRQVASIDPANDNDLVRKLYVDALTGSFGDGSDGQFNSAGNETLVVPVEDESIIVKQYATSFVLNAGHTLTTDKRCRGLFIKVKGDVTIHGTVDMNSKAANIPSSNGGYVVLLKPAAAALGVGGSGGSGGSGASIVIPSGGTANGGVGGAGSNGLWSGGARGGGGGGGASMGTRDTGDGEEYYGDAGQPGGASSPGLPGEAGNLGPGVAGSGGGGGNASYTSGNAGAGGSSLNGGGGGGGGGAGGSNGGPGGAGTGWGGGLVCIIASGNVTIGATGVIRADGAPGGAGGSPGGGGGGGGCGGGIVAIFHGGTYSNSGTIQAYGGNGGSAPGGGNSQPGAAGGIGTITVAKVVA
jgi:hypothetical protein